MSWKNDETLIEICFVNNPKYVNKWWI